MPTAAAAPGSTDHLLAGFGNQLPFHALSRLVRGPRNLLKCLIQGKVMPDRILQQVSHIKQKDCTEKNVPASQWRADVCNTHTDSECSDKCQPN